MNKDVVTRQMFKFSNRDCVCTTGGRSVDVSVHKDSEADARSNGLQCIGAYSLSAGISSSAQSGGLLARTTSAVVGVSLSLHALQITDYMFVFIHTVV